MISIWHTYIWFLSLFLWVFFLIFRFYIEYNKPWSHTAINIWSIAEVSFQTDLIIYSTSSPIATKQLRRRFLEIHPWHLMIRIVQVSLWLMRVSTGHFKLLLISDNLNWLCFHWGGNFSRIARWHVWYEVSKTLPVSIRGHGALDDNDLPRVQASRYGPRVRDHLGRGQQLTLVQPASHTHTHTHWRHRQTPGLTGRGQLTGDLCV